MSAVRPFVVCHMMMSVDGRILPARWTRSPDSGRRDWTDAYATIHESLDCDAWLVGRVTMAELSRVSAHAPQRFNPPPRPHHFATRSAEAYAIAVDASGKLHFAKPDIEGDAIVVLLGRAVADSHLAELAADGVSYLVASTDEIDLGGALQTLGLELGLRRLALEGGGAINGAFFAAGLVDELSVLVAPALDGRRDSPALVDFSDIGLTGKAELSLTSCDRLDGGLVRLRYAVGLARPA